MKSVTTCDKCNHAIWTDSYCKFCAGEIIPVYTDQCGWCMKEIEDGSYCGELHELQHQSYTSTVKRVKKND